jgi:hypothetical protein
VHSARLEQLGEGFVVCSDEMVAAHWVKEPMAEASASRSLDTMPESLVVVSRMDDAIHASAGEPCSDF